MDAAGEPEAALPDPQRPESSSGGSRDFGAEERPAVDQADGSAVGAPRSVLLINAGSDVPYVDSRGRRWEADRAFVGGTSVARAPVEIEGTDDDQLYLTERYGLDGYVLPLPDAVYHVRLHFAETYEAVDAAGQRLFDVEVEGKEVKAFDPIAAAGARAVAHILDFPSVEVADGALDVKLRAVRQNTMINAIEVTAAAGGANDGGPAGNNVDGAPVTSPDASAGNTGSLPYLVGVNLAGAEFGQVGGAHGQAYIYPGTGEIDYFRGKGMNVARVPILAERLQPAIRGSLDAEELGRLKSLVSYGTSKSMYMLIDAHNYGRFHGRVLGVEGGVDDFANFWQRVAEEFKQDPRVIFDIMNEPHDM